MKSLISLPRERSVARAAKFTRSRRCEDEKRGEVTVAEVIVVTSGKGGVGKTTTAAAIAAGIAMRGKKTVVIDFDVGLRNLDLVMGCERRVVFDFINVINGDAQINQALIRDKKLDTLYVFPTSQTRDKNALKREGVDKVMEALRNTFDYIVCDSPAGIEHGAMMALYHADTAIIVTNPEVSSVRDSDRIIGLLAAKSRRAERNEDPVKEHLLLTRYAPDRVARGEMMSVEDVREILSVPLLGIVPESESVMRASNTGIPVIFNTESPAARAYADAVARLLGEQREMRFAKPERRNLFRSIFGRA
jgi:septum site-determining protein MinD